MTNILPQRLWNRNFTAYWLGMAFTALGDAFILIALPFLILEVTGSAGALATVVLLSAIPRFLGPLTGALADRLHLRLPFVGTGLLRAALFATIALLAQAGILPIWLVYVAAPLNGLLTSFTTAAGMVLLPGIVPRSEVQRANSLMQGVLMGVPLLGLGLAGAMVGFLGVAPTILVATPCLLALAIAAFSMRFPDMPGAQQGLSVLGDMSRALRFLAGSGPLKFIPVMSLALSAALSLLSVTMPVSMLESGRGATGYGLFESFLSAGLLLGIITVSFAARKLVPRTLIGLAQLLVAAGFVMLDAGGFAFKLAGGFLLGTGLGATEVSAVTLLQLAVPDGMRGKVLGLVFTANAMGFSLGAWIAGLSVGGSLAVSPFVMTAILIGVLAVTWLVLQARNRVMLDRLAAPAL